MIERPFGYGQGGKLYCTQCGYELIKHAVSTDLPKYKYYCSNCGRNYIRNTTYDFVADAVRSYWKKHYPQEMVAFFYQRYDYEYTWEWHQELIECEGSDDYESVTFLNDFCEGQTEIKCLTVLPLNQILDYYTNTHNKLQRKE